MEARYARFPGVALVFFKKHMGNTASLEIRVHGYGIDGGSRIRNPKRMTRNKFATMKTGASTQPAQSWLL
jgi:hypothetical protein